MLMGAMGPRFHGDGVFWMRRDNQTHLPRESGEPLAVAQITVSPCVYILASRRRGTLYVGSTLDIRNSLSVLSTIYRGKLMGEVH